MAAAGKPGGYRGYSGALQDVAVHEVDSHRPYRTILATPDVMYALLPDASPIASRLDPGVKDVEARFTNFAALLHDLAAHNYTGLRVWVVDREKPHVHVVPQLPSPRDLLSEATWGALRDRGFTVKQHYEARWMWYHWLCVAYPLWASATDMHLTHVDITWESQVPRERCADYYDDVLAVYAKRNTFGGGDRASGFPLFAPAY